MRTEFLCISVYAMRKDNHKVEKRHGSVSIGDPQCIIYLMSVNPKPKPGLIIQLTRNRNTESKWAIFKRTKLNPIRRIIQRNQA